MYEGENFLCQIFSTEINKFNTALVLICSEDIKLFIKQSLSPIILFGLRTELSFQEVLSD